MVTPVELIEATLIDRGVEWERSAPSSFVVTLPGTHKLKTVCDLIVGDYTLRIESFVLRAPDENREAVWRWLLRHNASLATIAFAIDEAGDVYLMGRVPLASVTAEEIDRLLGLVLTTADESFNPLLELGYAGAIRREWAWRVAHGEPTTNLAAFAHLIDPDSAGAG